MSPCLLLLLCCLHASSAFVVPPTNSHSRHHEVVVAAERGQSRGEAVFQALGGVLGSALLASTALPLPARAGLQTVDRKKTFPEAISIVLLSKKILTPVRRYIEIGQYDPARTNVNYCTKILRLKKAMQSALDSALEFADIEKFETAAEATAVYDNILSQLDSSIYTLIFIPSDGESFSPQSLKFQKMAYDFYDTVMEGIDKVLALADDKAITEAQLLADAASKDLPRFLFKEFDAEFYRPATP